MREILFRGKQKEENEWVFGYLFNDGMVNSKRLFIGEIIIEDCKGSQGDYLDVTGTYFYEAIPETVCQYTGLTNKNGTKIFEGDIVRDIFEPSIIGMVKYGKYRNTFNDDGFGGHVGFYIEWKDKAKLLRKDLVYWAENSEFIVNIFDNPELLAAEE